MRRVQDGEKASELGELSDCHMSPKEAQKADQLPKMRDRFRGDV